MEHPSGFREPLFSRRPRVSGRALFAVIALVLVTDAAAAFAIYELVQAL